ncbi:MAG: polysaccharide biosynthesis protein [Lentisphaerae bacterium]|nr:polysaccharide biosynthesis protein [Lentisphaerota bacterium]
MTPPPPVTATAETRWIDRVAHTIATSVPIRRLLIATWHVLGVYVTYLAAFIIRFDGQLSHEVWSLLWNTLPILIVVYLAVFAQFRLYSGMWSYFSVDDLGRMGLALATGTAIFSATIFALHDTIADSYPRSIIPLEFLLMSVWMTGGRFAVRYWRQRRGGSAPDEPGQQRILVIGRTDDADLLLRVARQAGLRTIVGIVTDDAAQTGLRLHGITIRGTVADLGVNAKTLRANLILVLPPFNRPRQLNEIVEQCAAAGVACSFRTVPSLGDLAGGQISASSIREVDVEDLLGRGPARFDRTEVRHYLKGKRVLITGAGGSIGSELCRQVASYEPACLVLFELSEFALYSIEQELHASRPSLKLLPCAGDVRQPDDIEAAIRAAGGVDVIYHAAAYKHVPLMEGNVPACFRTNVLGTARLARVARDHGVDRFVLISSDKAVHPTSIMGATKHLAERVVNAFPPGRTSFVSVRFGNVLGSSGSVVPLFKQQIAAGGPVTVTTPDVRRFFMTIPEAVDLVLMAGTVGRNGDIMVLEMGDSIRIVDLARRLIELSGLVPDRDIRIAFTGLRPGEKEYEEVMTADENVLRTAYDKIWVLSKPPGSNGAPHVDLERIQDLVTAHDEPALRQLAAEWVLDHHFPWTSTNRLKENV